MTCSALKASSASDPRRLLRALRGPLARAGGVDMRARRTRCDRSPLLACPSEQPHPVDPTYSCETVRPRRHKPNHSSSLTASASILKLPDKVGPPAAGLPSARALPLTQLPTADRRLPSRRPPPSFEPLRDDSSIQMDLFHCSSSVPSFCAVLPIPPAAAKAARLAIAPPGPRPLAVARLIVHQRSRQLRQP